MKRPEAHQIDELAKRVFADALPATWVCNGQHSDYGIDYLVQIGDDNGELTGINFFVQLKGQKAVSILDTDGSISFSLKSKHASYYLDNVKDLPVFLVVVDVSQKCGWVMFLQRELQRNQAWRKQDSRTLYLPQKNDLHNIERFRAEVEVAKDWMRRKFPDFHTPFLQQCVDHLFVEHDLDSAGIIDDGMIERMFLRWGPNNPNGISFFDPEMERWEHGVAVDLLHIDVFGDGWLSISPCDDDGCYSETRLHNPEEILEIMHVTESLTEVFLLQDRCEQILLSDLLDNPKLIVPLHDTHVLLSPQTLVKHNPDLLAIINAYFGTDSDARDQLIRIRFPGWEQWCSECLSLPVSPEFLSPNSETCVYSERTGYTSYRRWLAFDDNYRSGPFIAMNRKPNASLMYLCDYFNNSETGSNQIKTSLNTWVTDETYGTATMHGPVSKLGQIRQAVEWRARLSGGESG